MPHRSRVITVVCSLGLVLGLSACAPTTVDLAAADAWLASVAAERADADLGVGIASGNTSPVGDRTDAAAGVTLTLGEPGPVAAVEVRCFGGHTATVFVEAATATGSRALQSDIACDEQPHRLDLADAGRTTAVTVDVAAEPETRFYAEVD
ncbi:MAG: hypothetical protein K0S49_646 [Microbacterium sp.]|jgi:hypothetical protein|nr:hypothetical protein [Microbacterium sp.]